MAQIFEAEFYDDRKRPWLVKMYDSNHTGAVTDLRLAPPGFATKWDGDETSPFGGIMVSSTQFSFINERVGGEFDTWLANVPTLAEGDVTIAIYNRELPTIPYQPMTWELWWAGVVLIDGIEQPDEPVPSVVTLTAVDDLAHLKDVRLDFSDGTITGFPDVEGLAYFMHYCLLKTRQSHVFESTDLFWRYVSDILPRGFFDTTYSPALTHVWEELACNFPLSPNEINPVDGTRAQSFIWDLLQSFCITFNLRLFFARGAWSFWPVNVHFMDADDYDWTDELFAYDKAGDRYSYATAYKNNFYTRNQVAIQASDENFYHSMHKLAGGVITHSTPVKYVKRSRSFVPGLHIANQSILYNGNTNDHILDETSDLYRLQFSDDRTFFAGSRFSIYGTINVGRPPEGGYTGPANTLNLRLRIDWTCGTYKWQNGEGWVDGATAPAYYYIGTDTFSSGIEIIEQFSLSTEMNPLPADSNEMDLDVILDFTNGAGVNWSAALLDDFNQTTAITILNFDYINNENSNALHFVASTNKNNQVTYNQGQVVMGSVAGGSDEGHIVGYAYGGMVNNNKRGVDDWHSYRDPLRGTDADGKHIHRLAVGEICAFMQDGRPLHRGKLRLNGLYSIPLTPLNTITTDGGDDYWLILSMTFEAATRTHQVTRMQLDFDLASVVEVTGDEGDTYIDEGGTTGEGGNPGTGDGTEDPTGTLNPGHGDEFDTPGMTFGNGNAAGRGGSNAGKQIVAFQEKLQHVTAEATGITSISVKSGSKALTADEVDDASTTNKFSTAAQLEKVDYLSVSASTDVDDLKLKSQAHFVALDLVNNNATARTGQVGVEVAWWDADGQLGSVGDGTSGQVLTTNGSGVLSWTTPAAGGTDGWHGSDTAIKVLPHEFTMNDDYNRAPIMVEDDTAGTLGIKLPAASSEAYAMVAIPAAFDATHVQVHASASTASAVEVYQYNHKTGAITSKGSGNFNATIDITDVTSSATASLCIKIIPASSTTLIYGATITISET